MRFSENTVRVRYRFVPMITSRARFRVDKSMLECANPTPTELRDAYRMKRRSQIAMTTTEVNRFLEEDGYTLQLATNGTDGFPHLVAMWYGMVDGNLHFNTYATSQKAKNLERDPRVTCMVEAGSEYAELRGVVIQGTAERVDARDEVVRISAEIGKRYPRPKVNRASGRGPRVARARVVYRVQPRRIYSWDHRKLPTGVY